MCRTRANAAPAKCVCSTSAVPVHYPCSASAGTSHRSRVTRRSDSPGCPTELARKSFVRAQAPAVIHGDLKPSNVLVETVGSRLRGRLLDFGLSRVLSRSARPLGGAGVTSGVSRGSFLPEVARDPGLRNLER